jgi:predicted XRE-type DNA-binding protein
MRKEPITRSSGNVFADLGFAPDEVATLTQRSDLIARLRLHIQQNRWTQARAAAELGMSQSRVRDLVRGTVDIFSLDMLLAIADRTRLQRER